MSYCHGENERVEIERGNLDEIYPSKDVLLWSRGKEARKNDIDPCRGEGVDTTTDSTNHIINFNYLHIFAFRCSMSMNTYRVC